MENTSYSFCKRGQGIRWLSRWLASALVLFVSLTALGQKHRGKYGDSTLIFVSNKHYDLYILGDKKVTYERAQQRLNAKDSSYPYEKMITIYRYTDLIVKNDSSIIYGNILKEDETTLKYEEDADKKHEKKVINKTEVLKYYNNGYEGKQLFLMADSGKSLVPQINYANVKPARGDTIHVNKYREYEFRGSALNMDEVMQLLKNNPLAYKKMKKANQNRTIAGFAIGICSAGALVALRIPGDTEARVAGGLGALVVGAAIGTPLIIVARKNAREAIKIFNVAYR